MIGPEEYTMADLTWPFVSMGILVLIVLIGALVLWKTLRDKKSGFPLSDERTQHLNGKVCVLRDVHVPVLHCSISDGQYRREGIFWHAGDSKQAIR